MGDQEKKHQRSQEHREPVVSFFIGSTPKNMLSGTQYSRRFFKIKHLIALFNISTPPAELLNKSQQESKLLSCRDVLQITARQWIVSQ